MTRLLLIRHAESEWNAQQRWQGRADPPLSEVGRREARRAGRSLRDAIDAVVASPQIRAHETAQIIAAELGLGPVPTEAGLREVDVGLFSGLTAEEVEQRFPREIAAWRTRDINFTAPGGESRADMLERALEALHRIAAERVGKRVLVLTHGGVIGTVERYLGAEPGHGAGNLSGRWFTYDGELRPDGDRVHLITEEHEEAPEAR